MCEQERRWDLAGCRICRCWLRSWSLRRARRGVELTGPGGLLTGLTKQVLESALRCEMAEHLGHDQGRAGPAGSGNVRNGTAPRRSAPTSARCRIDVPRDRAGTFDPLVVPKHPRRLAGFDEAVISACMPRA